MAEQDRYSRKELAAIFGRTTRTIDRWWKSGRIPQPKKMVRERYWDRDQVEQARQMLVGQQTTVDICRHEQTQRYASTRITATMDAGNDPVLPGAINAADYQFAS